MSNIMTTTLPFLIGITVLSSLQIFMAGTFEVNNVSTGNMTSMLNAAKLSVYVLNVSSNIRNGTTSGDVTSIESIVSFTGAFNAVKNILEIPKLIISTIDDLISILSQYAPGLLQIKSHFETIIYLFFVLAFLGFVRGYRI